MEVPQPKLDTPPRVVENDRAKMLWDFQVQTNKKVMANQLDKPQMKIVGIDVTKTGCIFKSMDLSVTERRWM